ncbi:hypothetical protein ACJRO7_008390 [Eucalyptus globulus]|uniref:Uncharacterized protein n=1 Tax=Eucalyptus globulus TaxID=34317 RepID=A0ABD3IQW8_EUCGL
MSLQKKLTESRRPAAIAKPEPAPDLTDFMNDMFFGTVSAETKAYNLTGSLAKVRDYKEDDFDSSTRSNSSRLTQAWLEEAKQMVATSPGRCDSPSRLVGSPRFAVAAQGRLSLPSKIDGRDPLSRSARRHRAVDSFSGEILSKSVRHGRNRSETLDTPLDSPTEPSSPAESVHRWFSNILKPPNADDSPQSPHSISTDQPPQLLLPRQLAHRRSRFQNGASAAQAQAIPAPPRRFRTAVPSQDEQLLSPPKNLVESAHRRSISSSTCSVPDNQVLSLPRSLVESAHRRSVSSSTCSLDKITSKAISNGGLKEGDGAREVGVNGFLKKQRSKIGKIFRGEVNARAKIILSGPSNS